ncbi:MAG: hypothetical protein ACUVTX_08715, partial [Bacteroidales bacterium]
MRKILFLLVSAFIAVLLLDSCKGNKKEAPESYAIAEKEMTAGGLIKIGTDVITEVVLKPDINGDPWELEKIKGFNGEPMFLDLINKINRDAIKVYDCITGEELSSKEIKKILKETGSDISGIGKIQFTEDWYFNP